MNTLKIWRDKLRDKKAELKILNGNLQKQESAKQVLEGLTDTRKHAHSTIQMAAQLTQETLQEQLGSVVSMSLSAVFEDPYEFIVEFVSKRNTTECNLLFERDGERCSPLDDSGYGPADIASIALRLSYWTAGDTRPVILMDEPCKNLSKSYHTLAAVMFQEMCKKLGIQMVVITHITDFREGADKLFMVNMDHKGVSHVQLG